MAGRSVGSIEVTVDADTGKLKAQLTKAGAEGGAAYKKAAENEIRDLEAEVGDVEVKKGAAAKAAQQIEESLDDLLASVGVKVDEHDIVRVGEEIEESLDDLLASVGIDSAYIAETTRVEREMEEMLSHIDAQVGDLKDQKAFLAAQKLEREIEEILDDIKGKVNVSPDMTTVARTEAILDESFDDIEAEVDVGYNKASKAATDAALRRNFSDVGKQSGADFGGGFGGGLSTRMKFIIGGIVALMEPAAVALQGLTSMASSVLSSAFSGMAGAAGALAPMLAGVAASAVTLTVGFQGMGDAMGAVSEEFAASLAEGRAFNSNSKEIRAAMATLAPAAREVVTAFGELQPQFTAIRQVVQQNLFQGLARALSNLGEDVIPQIGVGLAGLARTFNSFFKGLAADAQKIDFGQLFADIGPIVDRVLDAFRALFRTIQPFLHAAAPAARMLADSFKAGAESIEDMVNAGAKSGNLTKFFVEGVESLREWGRLLQAAGDALFSFFEAGKGQGDSFVKSLTGAINEWDSWMESVEGQKALEKFFATGKAFAEDLKPVLTGLKGFFENLITPGAEKRFEEFAEAIGRVLPTLGSLFEVFGRTRILTTAAELLAQFAEVVDSILPDLQQLADVIGTTLRGAVKNLEPVFDALGRALKALGGPIGDVFVALGRVIEDLAGPVGEVVDTLGEAVAKVVTAIGPRVTELGEALGEVFERLPGLINLVADAFVFLIDAGTAVLGIFNDLPGPIQTVVLGLGALFLLRDKIGTFATGFLKVRDNITLLRPAFNDVGASFTKMFQGMKALDFSQVTAGMKTLGPALVQAGKSAASAAGVAIASALGIAFGAQMFAEAEGMQGKVMGVMTIIGSAVGAFAAGGPIVGAVSLGLGVIGAAFMANANEAKKAAAEVNEYTDALMAMEEGGDSLATVKTVMENLRNEQEKTRRDFLKMGLVIEDWAKGMVKGTEDAESGMADMLRTTGSAGKEIARALDADEVSVRQLQRAFEDAVQQGEGFGTLPAKFQPLAKELDKAGVSMEDFIELADFLADETEELGVGQEELKLRLAESGGSFDDLNPKIEETAGHLEDASTGADLAAQAFGYEDAAAMKAAQATGELDAAAIDTAAGLANLGDEAGNAATDTVDYKQAVEDLEEALGKIDITKVFSDAGAAAARFEGLRRKMEETVEAAGAMKSAFDLLVGGQLSAQEATSNFEQTIDDLNQIMVDGEGIGGQFAATFDLTEEGGRNVAEALRGGIEQIGAWGEAQIATGKGAAETAAGMKSMREGLIDVASQFFASREEAAAFVNTTLGLDDTKIDMAVEVAGMQKALDDLTEFDRDLDGIPDSKDFQFNAPTIETIRAKAAELGVDISKIPDDVVVEFFANKLRESLEDVEILGGDLDDIDGQHPEAVITVRNEEALAKTRDAAEAAGNFEGGSYEAVLQANDEAARDTFQNAAIAAGEWSLLNPTTNLKVEDEATPVIDTATFVAGAFAGLNPTTTVAVDDQATPEIDEAVVALGNYEGFIPQPPVLAVDDQATQTTTNVATALGNFEGYIVTPTVRLTDEATMVVDPVTEKLTNFEGWIPTATLRVVDEVTPVFDPVAVKLGNFEGWIPDPPPKLTVTDEASGPAGEAKTAVEGLQGMTAEATVSLINNVLVLAILGAIAEALEILNKVVAKPKIELPTHKTVTDQLTATKTALTNLDNQVATPSISLPTWFTVISQVGALSKMIREIPDGSANITVTGVQTGIDKVRELQQEIRELSSKTITVTTRNVTVGGSMTGSIVPGSQTGSIVRGPRLLQVGEHGYDEAIIPLQLPLNRVDPSVRELAALLRGEVALPKAGPTKIINQYMTVNTVVQDPVAVATQVVNRSAMLAHN